MNSKSVRYLSIVLIGVALGLTGCKESDYTRMVKSELAKGIRQDSVLLGLNLGDSKGVFFGKCFDLNKEHVVTQGVGISVQYHFKDSVKLDTARDVTLMFYPEFDTAEVISAYNLEFSYSGWAPWNRHLQSDTLRERLKFMMKSWYGGNDFVIAKVGDSEVPVKVDGNRRIMLYLEDPQHVLAKVEDILHPEHRHSIKVDVNQQKE